MARCGCGGQTCSCVVQGSGAISVLGSGSPTNPYIISGGASISVLDTATIDLTKTGAGSAADPYILQADLVANLGDLANVDTSVTTAGYVLARQGDGTFAMVPAATATPGSITVGNGLQGDGSSGNALRVKLASNSGLTVDGTGLYMNAVPTDSGYVSSSVVTPASGWSVVEGKVRRWGPVCFLQLVIQRTGSAISSNGSGNIVNLSIATVTSPYRPQTGMHAAFATTYGGIIWGGALSPSGSVLLNALPPNVPVDTGDVLYGSACFLTDLAF